MLFSFASVTLPFGFPRRGLCQTCTQDVIPPRAIAARDPFFDFTCLVCPGTVASAAFIFSSEVLPWIYRSTHRGQKAFTFSVWSKAVKERYLIHSHSSASLLSISIVILCHLYLLGSIAILPVALTNRFGDLGQFRSYNSAFTCIYKHVVKGCIVSDLSRLP